METLTAVAMISIVSSGTAIPGAHALINMVRFILRLALIILTRFLVLLIYDLPRVVDIICFNAFPLQVFRTSIAWLIKIQLSLRLFLSIWVFFIMIIFLIIILLLIQWCLVSWRNFDRISITRWLLGCFSTLDRGARHDICCWYSCHYLWAWQRTRFWSWIHLLFL